MTPALSRDGRSVTWIARTGPATGGGEQRLLLAGVDNLSAPIDLHKGNERLEAPAIAGDGERVAFQMMTKDDWEIYLVGRDGKNETRVTRDIQHDVVPQFLSGNRLLAMIGEARHRRSFIYEPAGAGFTRTRLFHNNTVRTIAPEYIWVPSADGTKLLTVAERDGDTVSLPRGVYLTDLSTKVTAAEVKARVAANLKAERALRENGRRLFAPIAQVVKSVTTRASVERVFAHEKALVDFDSKHITRPGNKLASEYLFNAYASFGYAPEYQWFSARNAPGGQTANVIATLKGTVNPELVYVVSSHYDSVAIGPGADDDTSGTAALLETARIMAGHPMPATIVFASFTGEEAGLLGSREFVRRAVEGKVKLVGALNNDMIGWAKDHRIDNTIRYSNPGIRDIQHGAAIEFSSMILYDALYYKSTDAAAYYEAYGDIVGGLGSYPVLSNPHYHQSHDMLEGINYQQITEVAKTTAATLMLLASSPSRLAGLDGDGRAGRRGAQLDAESGNRRHRISRHLGTGRQPGAPHHARYATESHAAGGESRDRRAGEGGQREGVRGLGLGERGGEVGAVREPPASSFQLSAFSFQLSEFDLLYIDRIYSRYMGSAPRKLTLPPISAAEPGTLYQQIVEGLKREVSEGRLAAGAALPSFRSLAEELLVSVITVKRAYEELERDGIIYRRQGLGTFVSTAAVDRSRDAKTQRARDLLREALREGDGSRPHRQRRLSTSCNPSFTQRPQREPRHARKRD